MFHKLKQFNELRKKAQSLKSRLAEEKITMDHKGIRLVIDGNQEVQELTVNPEYLHSDKKNQLEAAPKTAFNDSVKKAQRVMAQKMRESGDFNIPGLS